MDRFDLLNSPLEGHNLIEAGAGTGKTYTIAGLYVRLLLEKRLSTGEILVVTFTVAATEELRDRIRKKIREALDAFTGKACSDDFSSALLKKYPDAQEAQILLTNALQCFDEAAVFTIHGFCQRVLQDKVFECGSLFNTELVTDQSSLVREVTDDFWRIHFYNASSGFISFVRSKKSKGFHPEYLAAFVSRNVGRVHLRILPETEVPDTDEEENACYRIFDEVRRAWQREKGEITNLLLTTEGLNRAKYSLKYIPFWLEEMDRYLEAGNLFPCFEKLDKFSTGALLEARKKGYDFPHHPFFDLNEELVKSLENLEALFERKLTAYIRKLLLFARQALLKRKEDLNVWAFDDLLLVLHSALHMEEGQGLASALRRTYPAALIDEFQDTDPVQYDIFKTIYPDTKGTLFLIGDPKQAIYRFRGADIFTYMEAAGEVDARHTLDTNWRSIPELIQGINVLFLNRENPFLFKEIPFFPAKSGTELGKESSSGNQLNFQNKLEGSPFLLWFMGRGDSKKQIPIGYAEKQICQAVAVEIGRLLKVEGQGATRIEGCAVEPGDMAVLVRTNRQARILEAILQKCRIPCVLYSTESLFTSPEAEELFRGLTAVSEYSSEDKIKAALVTDLLGVSGNELARLIEDETEWEKRLIQFRGYHELWARQGFITMAGTLMAEESVRSRLLAYPNGQRRLTNVLHLLEVLHQAALENKLGVAGLLNWFARQIRERPDKEEYQIRLETDEKAVKIVTIHRSKGLEYPIVFCPFCWSGSLVKSQRKGIEMLSFHDPNSGQAVIDLGSEQYDYHKYLNEKENLAENLRMLYVALTRAKYRCYLVWGPFQNAESSALAYLFHPSRKRDGNQHEEDQTAVSMSALNDDNEIREDLDVLVQKAQKAIRISSIPDDPLDSYMKQEKEEIKPTCRVFSGEIESDWHIASFSSLVSGRAGEWEIPGRDEGYMIQGHDIEEIPSDGGVDSLTIFDFPKGAKAGTCLHDILEIIDYDEQNEEVIGKVVRDRLAANGFDEVWASSVCSMLNKVLTVPLPGEGDFTLSSLSRKARVNEMEFYFPLERITSRELGEIFAACSSSALPAFSGMVEKLDFKPVRGLVKGYIDLVFCCQNRYYLADWKSNYLGPRIENYGEQEVKAAMEHEYYFLQYHLYTVALHKYLSGRISGYNYQTHFGGIFYIFLRGVDPEAGPRFGIYHDRPDQALIEGLSRYLCGK